MRISKIHLKNIGVFEDETIEFREKTDPNKAEIHILTGENGTGKSTILYALADSITNNNLSLKRFINYGIKSLALIYFDNSDKKVGLMVGEKGLQYVYDDLNELTFYRNSKIQHYQNQTFDFVCFSYSGYRNTINYQISSIQEITSNPFEHINNFNTSIQPQILIQWIANQKTKQALALASNEKNEAIRYSELIQKIETAISNIINKKIEFILERNPLNVVLKVDNVKLDFDVLPDGLKSILSWIADLLMRMDRIKWIDDRDVFDRNFILFLDEIEVHLHPAWQRKILPEIQKLFKNAQIFISTHSPFVVGSVDGAWVYQLENKDGNSKVVKVTESHAGESYGLILDEIFGINSEFDIETEEQFKKFYQIRNELFSGKSDREQEFLQQAEILAKKGAEVQSIIGREIRQANRVLNKDYVL